MKKIWSKFVVFALVVCLSGVVSVFAGCNTPTVDYEHTIIFYSSQGDSLQTITSNAIARFEAKYPGWKVEHTPQGGYDEVRDKVTQDLQGGFQPDLAYCYPDHVASYIQTQKVVDLNKYINSNENAHWNLTDEEGNVTVKTTEYKVGYSAEELADFVQMYYKEGYATNFGNAATYGYGDNAMLTLPFVKSTELLYYNKSALDACGFEVAKTWDELWAQCAKLVERYPSCTPLGYDSEANWFITMCEQNGWGYTSADSSENYLFGTPESKAKIAPWLEEMHNYYEKGYITTQTIYNAYTSGLFIKGAEDGGLIYCIGSSGGASHQNPGDTFKWGIAPIPGSEVNGEINNSVISQGPSLVMFTGGNGVTNASEKEMMTFMFIKELLDPTFQAAFSIGSGYNSARLSAVDVPEYQEHLAAADTNIVAKAAQVSEQLRDKFFVSPAFNGSSTARTQAGNIIVYCLKGEKQPMDALADAYQNCGGKNQY